jgi:hypothetical protein
MKILKHNSFSIFVMKVNFQCKFSCVNACGRKLLGLKLSLVVHVPVGTWLLIMQN